MSEKGEKVEKEKIMHDALLMRLCNCGSGLARMPLHDARGIFVAYVCERCEAGIRARYRPEIFTDAQYETCEAIEEQD